MQTYESRFFHQKEICLLCVFVPVKDRQSERSTEIKLAEADVHYLSNICVDATKIY